MDMYFFMFGSYEPLIFKVCICKYVAEIFNYR